MVKEIGLYIHIPFCVQKCKYCAFSSFTAVSEDVKDDYVKKVISEIKIRTANIGDRKIKWIYIGGGTPNTLSLQQLEKIVVVLPKDYEELSIELNPGVNEGRQNDLGSLEFLHALRTLGFNRLSVGVQSFNDDELMLLGRIHDSVQAKSFLVKVKESEFENYNVDLMMGLPHQSLESILKNIEIASSFEPTHISSYLLSIDSGTPFAKLYEKGLLEMPKDIELEKIYFSAIEKLKELNYDQYETSNFSKFGYECKYNLNTWENKEYVGCGLSAGSYIDNNRFDNTTDLEEYLVKPIEDYKKNILSVDVFSNLENKLLLGLRLRKGTDVSSELERTPIGFQNSFQDNVRKLVSEGFLEKVGDLIRIPQNKILLSDIIIEKLIV